jgi:hypothetical protein
MDLSYDFTEKLLQFWRGREIRRISSLAMGGNAGFLRLRSRLSRSGAGFLGACGLRSKFGDPCIPVVKLGVE